MSCNHRIGKEGMVLYLNHLVSTNQYELRCNFPGCGAEWTWKECRKVGVLTVEEINSFDKALS